METLSSHFFRESIQGARRKGVDTDRVLRAADVDPALLEDPTARGDIQSMARLIQQVWYSMDDEFMGFTEHQAKVGVFGLMTRFLVPCESLEQVLHAGMRFYNLVRTDMSLALEVRGEVATFEARFSRPELDPNHYFMQLWMVIWLRLAGWLTGGPLPLRWASFTFARPETFLEDLRRMFPCEHRYGQTVNCFAFDAQSLRMPVVRTLAELKAMLEHAPLLFLAVPEGEAGLARRVRSALVPRSRQPVAFPGIEAIAERFHMTPQTLRRRLKREGASFVSIKEDIRRDLAIQKVLKGESRIEDIAHAVGYAETRCFTRAFRQWTGFSPVQYRARFLQAAEKFGRLE